MQDNQPAQSNYLPKRRYWKAFHQGLPRTDKEGDFVARIELRGIITQIGGKLILAHARKAFYLKWPMVEEISEKEFNRLSKGINIHIATVN